jgi:hypothetical protein
MAQTATPAASGQPEAALAAAVRRFADRVKWAVSDAYVELHDLGLDDAQIVVLLGLPTDTPSPADIPVPAVGQAAA